MATKSKSGSTTGQKKRGLGRPPGSKNKPKTESPNPTKQEVASEMQRRSDRDRRNLDVIWSITFFALSLFLFFTVVMDATGSFGRTIHDICLGLFGFMAYALPFLVFVLAVLLMGGKMQHIGARTAIFSVLIFINLCILNSYRFIAAGTQAYGLRDIAEYYVQGVDGKMGGVIGMELGCILAKFFGLPGLLIISLAVLIISIFLVANTPISRFFEKAGKRREEKRILKELEADETDPNAAAESAGSQSKLASFWGGVMNMLGFDEEAEEPQSIPAPDAASIPAPFGNRSSSDKIIDEIEYTQIMDSPLDAAGKKPERSTFYDKIKGFFAGIDSETGENLTQDKLDSSEEDYGYPGRRSETPEKKSTGLGLQPDSDTHSSGFGLDGHGASSASATASAAALNPAGEDFDTARSRARESAKKASEKSKAKQTETSKGAEVAADAAIAAGFASKTDDSGYELPPVSLLKRPSGPKHVMTQSEISDKAAQLERTLNDFGVDAKVINVTQGASVTRYEVQPATGVKVSRITGLADDIALNMRAKTVRIEAPIPGKAAVGIEVENAKPSPVLIRELIESEEFTNATSKIEFAVGKDISGNNIVADMKEMPHLLVAGATGSGKSVCINTIITSFLYKAKPSELRLIMIDPKMVELGNYNGIPHMLTPVVTDPRKAARALAIAVEEMEKRYEAFSKEYVKDLGSYNDKMRSAGRHADVKPEIIIIIDELADLMMAAPNDVENAICRLAQKARAAGMHLIVATQRPSVDVVTGLIKANIPSRIAFTTTSSIDSRTILDTTGAEKLLGKGDMLFSPVGSTKPYRVQGTFISAEEIEKVIKFVKKEGGEPDIDEEFTTAIENNEQRSGGEAQDELTEDAIAFIFKSKQASVSMLQRRFRIGYNRAARIIDEIEEMGIIGPPDGSRPRQLLMTEEQYMGAFADPEPEYDPEPEPEIIEEPEPELAEEPEPVIEDDSDYEPEAEKPEMAPEDDGLSSDKLSNTQAMDSFNSLPESVRRMVMDADSSDDY